ncbi:MAG: methyltransferase family protein [Bacillota bacterium]
MKRLKRWLESTSNRTFIVWPVVLFAIEAIIERGMPVIHWWAVPLLAWGYLQYKLVGTFRTREGGGGPGLSNPPERILERGPYRWTRNPMYLGHLVFFAGLALALGSWIGAAVLLFHAVWFDRRVRDDEANLAELFGEPYREYRRRVSRWIPGIY